jgi:hypothetical protein
MVSTTGWNAINSISGASVLAALSDGKCPQWAGVLIICTTVWIICVLGISWIHRLDAFLWISPFVVWCVAAGTGAPHLHGDAIKSPTGPNGAAAALSFMAVVFSFAVSWINCAADYNVKMPVNTPRYKIFWATYAGICEYLSKQEGMHRLTVFSYTNRSRSNTRRGPVLRYRRQRCLEARLSGIRRWRAFENGPRACRRFRQIPYGVGSI